VCNGVHHIDKEDFSSNSGVRWVPETPHNPVQLQLQFDTIQQLLREQNSCFTLIKTAFNQLIKGCELAMHGGILMQQEIEELRTVNASLQQKLHRLRKRLVHTGSLTRQEAQELAQSDAMTQNASESNIPSTIANPLQTRPRRPPKCSECGNVGHNRVKCPNLASH